MKSIALIASALCGVMLLAGCGESRQDAPAPDVTSAIAQDSARIFIGSEIARNSTSRVKVFVDGGLVGRIGAKGYLVIDHKPGAFTITIDKARTGTFTMPGKVDAGSIACFAVGFDAQRISYVKAVAKDKAKEWIAESGQAAGPAHVYGQPPRAQNTTPAPAPAHTK